jgi:DNA-binding NarL/FixJ family response regulator
MAESKRIRILSVEDHPVFRAGLATVISSQSDVELTAQASNAIEGIAEFRKHRLDITLMDVRLPGSSGTDALVAIRGEFPDARVIMLTSSGSDTELEKAMRSGAAGYVLKTTPKNELVATTVNFHIKNLVGKLGANDRAHAVTLAIRRGILEV